MHCELCTGELEGEGTRRYCVECGQEYEFDEGFILKLSNHQKKVLLNDRIQEKVIHDTQHQLDDLYREIERRFGNGKVDSIIRQMAENAK